MSADYGPSTINSPADKMDATPAQPRSLIRPSVWMLDTSAVATAATATNTAVHVPWTESALSETERDSMPAPPTKIMTGISDVILRRGEVMFEPRRCSCEMISSKAVSGHSNVETTNTHRASTPPQRSPFLSARTGGTPYRLYYLT